MPCGSRATAASSPSNGTSGTPALACISTSILTDAVHLALVHGVVGVTILVEDVMPVEGQRVQHLHVPTSHTLHHVVGDASQLFFLPVDAGTVDACTSSGYQNKGVSGTVWSS